MKMAGSKPPRRTSNATWRVTIKLVWRGLSQLTLCVTRVGGGDGRRTYRIESCKAVYASRSVRTASTL